VIARLDPVKSIETFLDAVRLLGPRFPDVRFVVAGDDGGDNYKASLRDTAARLGVADRVTFTGFMLDVGGLLNEVAISVLPSTAEGLSNTLLESQAAGVPVVATSVGGNPEIVSHGNSGLLVQPRDPRALARAIERLLTDRELAARFSAAGRARVQEDFSIEQMVRRRERLWADLLRESR
jgi:glycosyltransferase involved in cell wall biosynthesis